MNIKILFVDDETNVLNALKRQFRKTYDVSLASSGAEGLKMLVEKGPFSVIISDMQMPEMNGVQFLQAAQKVSPDSVRLMLTGNADQQTAVDAVNHGSVFSFYTKPCTPEVLNVAIQKAIKQYQLITAERELLEGTLNGSVKLLMDMLSMVAPNVFTETRSIQEMTDTIINSLELTDSWNLKLASMLSNIAHVTLPPETLTRLYAHADLTAKERVMIKRLPEVAQNLVSNIPRLEGVANILLYQHKNFNGDGFPDDEVKGIDIPYESRVLKILLDIQSLKSNGYDTLQSIKYLVNDKANYDPQIFKIIAQSLIEKESEKS